MVHSTISYKKRNDLPDTRSLKASVDCRDIVRLFWGQPKRSTAARDSYFAQWRDDGSKASFSVTSYGYRDFGGVGVEGSVYDFLMHELNCTFSQAVEWVIDYTHSRPVNAPQRQRQERPAASEAPAANWQHAAINFIEHAQQDLLKNEAVLSYLRYERLLTDETIRAAGLGWNPTARKVSGFWVEAGIVIPRYHDGQLRLVNIRTITGALADYLGVPSAARNGDPLDKYICMAGSKLIGSLYHPAELVPGRPTLFVEGELDCILAWQELGDTVNAVTLGGATNRITPANKAQIEALDSPICIALDNDGAGQDATRHAIAQFGEKAIALKYPAGYKDFTDFLNAGGDARAWFESQTSPYVFADGAPASWVSAMKTYMRPGAALLFVALQQAARARAIDPQRFAAADLLNWMHENGYPIAQPTLYRYLECSIDELFSKCKALSLSLSEGDKANALHFEKNPNGRPADTYCMVELSHIRRAISRQAWARLYDWEFRTDGKKGVKAPPRIAGLTRLGVPNAAAIAAKLDKEYEPIYRRQRWAHRYAEKRIQQKHTALIADLADLTPLKTDGHLIKRQSDLDEPIIQSRLTPGQPVSLKQIAQWTGKHHTRIGQDMRKFGYQSQRSECQVIPIKPGQDIRKVAIEANPHARWVGLKVDGNPDIQPFEQAIANRATSAALVIQPANTYVFVGKPEPGEQTEQPAREKKIDMKQSKAAPELRPSPYWGDDVSPEVDHNQAVLGLHLMGWEYMQDTGFWYNPASGQYCRTLQDAVLIQAGEPIETAPIIDAPAEKPEMATPPYVEAIQPVETPQIAYFSGPRINVAAMNRAGRQLNPFSADYDPAKLIYEVDYETE